MSAARSGAGGRDLHLLALKLLLAPALVGLASLTGRRFGPRAAGLAASLPIVAGPALLFFALEQGTLFAARAASGALLGLVPLSLFCLVHLRLAHKASRLPRGLSAPLCLLSGWAAFLAAALALRPLPVPSWAAPLVGAFALVAGLVLAPSPADDGQVSARHHPALELLLRMLSAALLLATLTGLAARLGPVSSGLLTPFPVASSVLVLGTHLAEGPSSLCELVRGFLFGLFGFVAFLAVLSVALVPLGAAKAFALGLCGSLFVAALLSVRPWRRARTTQRPGATG